jgi:hypothetical protein
MLRPRTLLAASLLASLAAFPILAAAQTTTTPPAASTDTSDTTKSPQKVKKFKLRKPSGAAAAAHKAKEPASLPGDIGAKAASTPK